MKILQDSIEEKISLEGHYQLKTFIRRPESPKCLILLLHGYNERGRRIFRRLLPYLPSEALILAPNGPFPLPRVKPEKLDFGYAWYFYNKFTRSYEVNQELALSLLKNLITLMNPKGLPVWIIGFSQGGYLAPLIGLEVSETKAVIGIGCEFRSPLLKTIPHFPLLGIHGDMDEIIPLDHTLREIAALQERGINVKLKIIKNLQHEINSVVGQTIREIVEEYGK